MPQPIRLVLLCSLILLSITACKRQADLSRFLDPAVFTGPYEYAHPIWPPFKSKGIMHQHHVEGMPDVIYQEEYYMVRKSKRSAGFFKNGKKDGLWLKWYKNGKKFAAYRYKEDEQDGIWQEWFDNGQMKAQFEYKDGWKHGQWTLWFSNGQKRNESTFEDGKKVGAEKIWYKNGQLAKESFYVGGTKEGEWKIYADDGTITDMLLYKDDELIRAKQLKSTVDNGGSDEGD